jgi:hypothetical protein
LILQVFAGKNVQVLELVERQFLGNTVYRSTGPFCGNSMSSLVPLLAVQHSRPRALPVPARIQRAASRLHEATMVQGLSCGGRRWASADS